MGKYAKEYVGIIIGTKDPKNEGRYQVNIPELIILDDDKKGLWCINKMGNYIRYKSGKKVESFGNYIPLKKNMMVRIGFTTNSLLYGEIIGLISKEKLPTQASGRDTYHQLLKTEDGCYIYYDEKKKLLHMMTDNGSNDILMHKDKIEIYSGQNIDKGVKGVKPKKTVFTLTPFGFTFSNDQSFVEMKDNTIEMRAHDKSYIKLHKDGIEIYGDKVKIHSKEETNIYSEKITRIQGEDEMHVLGNETRVTGYQTAMLNSNFVKINAAHHLYIISDNLNLISKKLISLKSKATKIVGSKLNLAHSATHIKGSIIALKSTVVSTSGKILTPTKVKVTGAAIAVVSSCGKAVNSTIKTLEKVRKSKDSSCLSTKNREQAKKGCLKSECNPAECCDKVEKPKRKLPANAHLDISTCVAQTCRDDKKKKNEKKFNKCDK